MQQLGSKYFARRPPTPNLTLGMGSVGKNSFFSEHGHIAYQIKENHKCRIMVANILPADPYPPLPPDPGAGIKRSKLNFFRTCCLLN